MMGWREMDSVVGEIICETFAEPAAAVFRFGDTQAEESVSYVIFDKRHELEENQDGALVNAEPIRLGVHFDALSREPVQDRDFVAVGGKDYVIREVQRDSGHLYTLILQERTP